MKKKTCVITGRSGFTLIEMLFTISVFAILATIAIPVFSKWLPSYHIKTAARDVYSNMQLARLTAVKQNMACTINLDESAGTYNVKLSDGSTVKSVSLDNYGKDVQFGTHLSSQPAAAASVSFNPRGMTAGALDAEYHVYLKNNKDADYQVVITGIGTINLKKWDGSSWR